jgi:phage shock protein PspC (stress-responsive transcriptional regulator)
MQKVIVVNLNGNAYQVDEPAFLALRGYLDNAAARLADNPDRAEILSDLEQAIADKCARFLGAHKTVVAASEIDAILAEMGPVDGAGQEPAGATGAPGAAGSGTGSGSFERGPGASRRLYQIADGAVISGVCNGLAAYFDVDPTIVRVIFVALAFLTGGFWILVYLVLMFVIPVAETPEQHAAAHGVPFNAHELIRRAKVKYAELTEHTGWKREWKRQRRDWRRQRNEWRRHWRGAVAGAPWRGGPEMPPSSSYATQLIAGALIPVFVVLSVAAFWAFAAAAISLLMTGKVLQWAPPSDLPLWAALLILFLFYQMIAWPLHAAGQATRYAVGRGLVPHSGLEHVIGLGVGILCFWLAYRYVPAVHDFVRDLPTVWPTIWDNLRQSWK